MPLSATTKPEWFSIVKVNKKKFCDSDKGAYYTILLIVWWIFTGVNCGNQCYFFVLASIKYRIRSCKKVIKNVLNTMEGLYQKAENLILSSDKIDRFSDVR